MAVDTESVAALPSEGVAIYTGRNRSIISDKASYQLKTGMGKVGQLIIGDVGTTWTIDIYDDTATTAAKKIFGWVTAAGVGPFALQCPMKAGIRVVSGGTTAGVATLVWD